MFPFSNMSTFLWHQFQVRLVSRGALAETDLIQASFASFLPIQIKLPNSKILQKISYVYVWCVCVGGGGGGVTKFTTAKQEAASSRSWIQLLRCRFSFVGAALARPVRSFEIDF